MGLNSGEAVWGRGWRNSPSPRNSARMPATQPRQDSWAMITVIIDTSAAMPIKT